MRVRSLLAAVVLGMAVVVTGVGVGSTSSAEAATCQGRSGVRHVDPTGRVFTRDWVCPNKRGASLYADPDYGDVTGWMHSSPSWFVCWEIGALHGGGNRIWYLTQGDEVAPGMGFFRAWGFMPAVNNYTSTDPVPYMPNC